MTTTRITPTVRDRLEALASPRVRQALGILTFAVITAFSARLELPIPGTSVPFTFQPLAVILAGALLGARAGAASQVLYLAAGLAGIPVFSSVALLGTTAGYLFAFPVAAFVVGSLAATGAVRNLVALLAGLAAIYAGGLAWLTILFGPSAAFALGFAPFIVPDLVKVGLALVVTQQLRKKSTSFFNL
jgi:biotin transport system substrate-specific component